MNDLLKFEFVSDSDDKRTSRTKMHEKVSYWLVSDFIPRKSKKSKNRKSDFKF